MDSYVKMNAKLEWDMSAMCSHPINECNIDQIVCRKKPNSKRDDVNRRKFLFLPYSKVYSSSSFEVCDSIKEGSCLMAGMNYLLLELEFA